MPSRVVAGGSKPQSAMKITSFINLLSEEALTSCEFHYINFLDHDLVFLASVTAPRATNCFSFFSNHICLLSDTYTWTREEPLGKYLF